MPADQDPPLTDAPRGAPAGDRMSSRSGSAPGPLELVVFLGAETRTFELPSSGEVVIGRAEHCQVRIQDPSVSRRHAVLRLDGKLEIEDLSGANGIFVRDRADSKTDARTLNMRQLVLRRADLGVGERILLGTATVVVRRAPTAELPQTKGQPFPDGDTVVGDPAMRALYQQAARAAGTRISVLLLGETGVGKEVLARAIHAYSPRRKGPFLGVNCAAIAESLLEGELFGNEKGAYTGALSARAGLFEAAQGGTVFLDEVGELPLATQGKLLRVLEEREVTRLGATRARPIDVRFIAATNRDIETDTRDGRFRSDLYFRLAGMMLRIPPLRERPAEIELLASKFLAAAGRSLERTGPLTLSSAALACLRRYPWPGNARELRNVIERAAVLCAGDTILPEDLPPSVKTASGLSSRAALTNDSDAQNLRDEIKSIERARIAEALGRCGGNQSRAAELLGMSRRTLTSRLSAFGLPRPRGPKIGSQG